MRARARGAAVSGKSGSRAGVIFRGGPPHFSRALYRPSRVQCTPTRRAAPSAGACIHRRGGLHGSRALFVVSPINVYIRGAAAGGNGARGPGFIFKRAGCARRAKRPRIYRPFSRARASAAPRTSEGRRAWENTGKRFPKRPGFIICLAGKSGRCLSAGPRN